MKLNYKRTVLIGMAFLSIAGFWQMYDNIIPLILQNTFGLGETVTGGIMALDNIFALFLLPVFGALSDKSHSRFGKRTPFIVVGTLLAVTFLMLLPVADQKRMLALFIFCLLGVLLSMGLYRSPAVALMPDLTPKPLRSKANAVINLMGAVGCIYVLIAIKLLLKDGEHPSYFGVFAATALLMLLSVTILVCTIREKKLTDAMPKEEEESPSDQQDLKAPMDPAVKKSLGFLFASIFLWFTAYNAVTTAFSRYTKVVWQLQGGGFADCLMVATVAAIISYLPIGIISSKIGRKKTILGGIVLMGACYGIGFFCTQYHPLINLAFAAIGIGWAAISVNSYPMVVEMAKGSEVGKYTGLYYIFSMAAQIFTPVFSGFLLENVSYRTLFPYSFVFSALAFTTMLFVRHGDSKPEQKKSLLENFDVDD